MEEGERSQRRRGGGGGEGEWEKGKGGQEVKARGKYHPKILPRTLNTWETKNDPFYISSIIKTNQSQMHKNSRYLQNRYAVLHPESTIYTAEYVRDNLPHSTGIW